MRLPLLTPFHALGSTGGSFPGPVLRQDRYVAGDEAVQVTLLEPTSLDITYRRGGVITTFRQPVSLQALHQGPMDQALVTLLGISEPMLSEIRGELLTRATPTDPMLRTFQNAQRSIFVDRFMGDTMDDVVHRPV